MICKFPNLKCVSRSGTECKLNICALENGEAEVKHTAVKKPGKICPILKKECIKESCEWYCKTWECCGICSIIENW